MVSRKVKEIISSYDPVAHHFIPLELHLHNGKVSLDEYFLFQAADRIEGVVEEKSNVEAVYDEDGRFRYYSCPSRPSITWKKEAIRARHIWVGLHLAWDVFVSDELEAEFQKLSTCAYDKLPSFVL